MPQGGEHVVHRPPRIGRHSQVFIVIDIFDALQIPESFFGHRAPRLEHQAGEFGVRIKARWRQRVLLVTSDITSLCAPLPMLVVEDLVSLTLDLGPPGTGLRYINALRDFAAHARAAERARPRDYERVQGPFGRVHLVRPFEAVAACGAKGFVEGATRSPITCRACAGLVLDFQAHAVDPLVSVVLRPDEVALAKKADRPRPAAPGAGASQEAATPDAAEVLVVSA